MAEKLLPRLQEFSDFAEYNLAGDDEEVVASRVAHIEEVGSAAFLADTPSYHRCLENGERLVGWCRSRGVPLSRWNLTVAFRDLSEQNQLTAAPPVAAPFVDRMVGVTLVREDTLLEYQPSADEAQQLEKLRDDTNLSDHSRKNRDERLRLLAGEQRRSLASANLYR
jgi:hypothetical protein